MKKNLSSRFIGLVLFMVAFLAPALAVSSERDDVRAMTAAVVSVGKQNVNQDIASKIARVVVNTAEAKNLDPLVILAVMNQESTFNPKAKSRDGSVGLMQVHYPVHKKSFAGKSPFDIEASVRIGVDIFSACMKRSNNQLFGALNCYSGGGGKLHYQRFLTARRTFEREYAKALFAPTPPTFVATL